MEYHIMMRWLKSLFSRDAKAPQTQEDQEHPLLAGYTALLTRRLREFHGPVSRAFAEFFASKVPDSFDILHIEIFVEEPAFSVRVFSMDKTHCQTPEPPVLQHLNKQIAALWPLLTEDEVDQFMIWEDDPKWGRQVALSQPIDAMDFHKLVIPWLRDIVSETKDSFDRKITANVHDMTAAEELEHSGLINTPRRDPCRNRRLAREPDVPQLPTTGQALCERLLAPRHLRQPKPHVFQRRIRKVFVRPQ
jgi:hypothetical protein